jgi:hypothetical protein
MNNTFPYNKKRGPDSLKKFQFGPLTIFLGFSKDPDDRLWGHTDENRRTRVRHLISLHFIEVPDGRTVWGIYLGSLCLYWGNRNEFR